MVTEDNGRSSVGVRGPGRVTTGLVDFRTMGAATVARLHVDDDISSSELEPRSSSVSPPEEAVECVGETRNGAGAATGTDGAGAVRLGVGRLAKWDGRLGGVAKSTL
jgi:hypothetical protein